MRFVLETNQTPEKEVLGIQIRKPKYQKRERLRQRRKQPLPMHNLDLYRLYCS